jgi:hypothetical protein
VCRQALRPRWSFIAQLGCSRSGEGMLSFFGMQISETQDRSADKSVDSALVIGTTNPFFIKCFEHWPNCLWVCGPSPSASDVSTPTARGAASGGGGSGAGAGVSSGGAASPGRPVAGPGAGPSLPSRVKPRVLPRSAPLTSVFPSPGQEHKVQLLSVCRAEPLVPPDPVVLSQLLTIRPEDELGACAMRVTPPPRGGGVPKHCVCLAPVLFFFHCVP